MILIALGEVEEAEPLAVGIKVSLPKTVGSAMTGAKQTVAT